MTMLEWYRLFREEKEPTQGSVEVIYGTREEEAQYRAEVERDRRDFEARMQERIKIKHIPCKNCGHLCAVHNLFTDCHEKTDQGEMFCNCPGFVAVA
jgi:hypothetical protein